MSDAKVSLGVFILLLALALVVGAVVGWALHQLTK